MHRPAHPSLLLLPPRIGKKISGTLEVDTCGLLAQPAGISNGREGADPAGVGFSVDRSNGEWISPRSTLPPHRDPHRELAFSRGLQTCPESPLRFSSASPHRQERKALPGGCGACGRLKVVPHPPMRFVRHCKANAIGRQVCTSANGWPHSVVVIASRANAVGR
jgi:hypothetical protein